MKNLILSLMFLAMAKVDANAIVVQKIHLKNGSVLNGYVQRQDGKGNMVVATDNAMICLRNDEVSSSVDEMVNIASLSPEWKEWAEKNDAYVGIGDSRSLLLSQICVGLPFADDSVAVDTSSCIQSFEQRLKDDARMFKNVRVLEKGTVIKFLDLTPSSYSVSWDDIESITADKRPRNVLSGINRTYTLESGREVSGQYAGETEATISLYQENGMVETFNYDDIKKYTFSAINPAQDIFAQSELIDEIELKRGNPVRGVIVEQNYAGGTDSENYISILESNKTQRIIKISDVKSISRQKNTAYDPVVDVILKEGEVVVNRKPVDFVKVRESGDRLVLDSLSRKVVLSGGETGGTKIVVEYHSEGGANVEKFQLVKVMRTESKKSVVYSFSYKDLVNSAYRARGVETSVNHTTKAEYTVAGDGVYALYDAAAKTVAAVIVKSSQ